MVYGIIVFILAVIAWIMLPDDDKFTRKVKFFMVGIVVFSLLLFLKGWYYNKGIQDANKYHLQYNVYK